MVLPQHHSGVRTSLSFRTQRDACELRGVGLGLHALRQITHLREEEAEQRKTEIHGMIWLWELQMGMGGGEEAGATRWGERTGMGETLKRPVRSASLFSPDRLAPWPFKKQTRLLGRSGGHVSVEAHLPAPDPPTAPTFAVPGRSEGVVRVQPAGRGRDCVLREDTWCQRAPNARRDCVPPRARRQTHFPQSSEGGGPPHGPPETQTCSNSASLQGNAASFRVGNSVSGGAEEERFRRPGPSVCLRTWNH